MSISAISSVGVKPQSATAGKARRQFIVDDFILNNDVLFRDGKEIALQPKELAVLLLLLEAGGEVVHRDTFLERVWTGQDIGEESLTRSICSLRRIFRDGKGGNVILTVYGQGYRFSRPVKREAGTHQPFELHPVIDNNLPILRDPQDVTRSLLAEAEKPIAQIAVTNRGGLILTPQQKARILAEVREWLRTEGAHGPKFDALLYVAIPLDDGGPPRGATVYARRDIRRFEVLGPYAGKLHGTDESLHREIRKAGETRILTYLWGTGSAQRSISGYESGNVLSLVNTSRLPGAAVAWRHNNVTAIRVGRNLTFYIANQEIKQATELLVDYGSEYNPAAAMQQPKDEPPDSDTAGQNASKRSRRDPPEHRPNTD